MLDKYLQSDKHQHHAAREHRAAFEAFAELLAREHAEERGNDEPDVAPQLPALGAADLPLLLGDLLRGGQIEPADVVLLEGIHVFYDPEVRDLMDFKIYVQVDPDVCLLRRVKRDLRDRGRTIESIYKQYLDTVKPMYEKHIRGYVEYADLIVARGGKNARIIDILAHYINSGLIESRD